MIETTLSTPDTTAAEIMLWTGAMAALSVVLQVIGHWPVGARLLRGRTSRPPLPGACRSISPLGASFHPTTFTKNRERLMDHDVARHFFGAVVEQAKMAGLTSNEHFSVDGTLIEAWASLKSYRTRSTC